MNLLATLRLGLALSLLGNTSAAQATCQPNWLPSFGGGNGMNGRVMALLDFDDGSGGGPALYASGDFTTAGGVAARRIAKWDGASWSALGNGLSASSAHSLAVFDDGSGGGPDLYVGGSFSVAGSVLASNIARWDGTGWSLLGSGTNGTILALAVFDDGLGGGPALYAGGVFGTAGGAVANSLAKWDGSSWSGVGGLGPNEMVTSLTVFDDNNGGGPALFVGGFASPGSPLVGAIAKWDGTNWFALGSGLKGNPLFPSNPVSASALTVFNDGGGDALFVGGRFWSAGNVHAENIAKWDGTTWTALGIVGIYGSSNVHTLAAFDDGGGPALYTGGAFPGAGPTSARNIAKWDGSNWSAIGSGTDDSVFAFRVFDDNSGSGSALFAGGQFTSTGGQAADRVGKLGRSTPVSTFCTAKTTLVCGPASICAGGISSATASSDFVIHTQPVRGCRAGLLLYSDQPTVPGVSFGGPGNGQLCLTVAGVRRAGPIDAGGTNPVTCDGVWSIDMNRFNTLNWSATGCSPPPGQNNPAGFLGNMGTTVNAQMWGRDSVATGQVLSEVIRWAVGP